MSLSPQTRDRLFQVLIGFLVALTAYIQAKQTQLAVQQSAVNVVSEVKEEPVEKVAASLVDKQAAAAQAVQEASSP